MSNESKFQPIEIAYRKLTMEGQGPWKRTEARTQKELDRKLARYSEENDYQVAVRPLETEADRGS